jgi:signal transduction histidine kinase
MDGVVPTAASRCAHHQHGSVWKRARRVLVRLHLISDDPEERAFAQSCRSGQLTVFFVQLAVYAAFFLTQLAYEDAQGNHCQEANETHSSTRWSSSSGRWSSCSIWSSSIGFTAPAVRTGLVRWMFGVSHGGVALMLIAAARPRRFPLLAKCPMLVDGTNVLLMVVSTCFTQLALDEVLTDDQFPQLPVELQHAFFVTTTANRLCKLSALIATGTFRAAYSWPLLPLAWGLINWQHGERILEPSYLIWLFTLSFATPTAAWILVLLKENALRSAMRQEAVAAVNAEELEAVRILQAAAKVENDTLLALSREKDNLLSMISHEMKTPLNGLLGMLQLAALRCNSCSGTAGAGVLSDPPANALARDINPLISKANTCGKLLLSLIDDILDSARLAHGTFSVVPTGNSVAGCVRNVASMLESVSRGKCVALTTEVDTSCERASYLVDSKRLTQVLANLGRPRWTSPCTSPDLALRLARRCSSTLYPTRSSSRRPKATSICRCRSTSLPVRLRVWPAAAAWTRTATTLSVEERSTRGIGSSSD